VTSGIRLAGTPRRRDAASLPTWAPRSGVAVPRKAFVAQIMGLPMSVHVRGPQANTRAVADAVDAAFASLRADDLLFSTYRSDSAVSRVRRGDLSLAEAGARVTEVAALCREAALRTDGAFSAWLSQPGGERSFDPTGLVKGWAVEQAFEALTQRLSVLDAHDVLISAGGDIVVGCTRIDTPDWSIGVEDPRDPSRLVMTIPLRRGAVATSGLAARGQHVIDPHTGRSAVGLLSATVIGPSLTWADVYATAAFVKGPGALAWLSTLPSHAGVLIGANGAVQTTQAR
jgi:thiamine biosynthesis lipoprotein